MRPPPMSDVAAIVMAAGLASRFRAEQGGGGPPTKLVADYDGGAARAACRRRPRSPHARGPWSSSPAMPKRRCGRRLTAWPSSLSIIPIMRRRHGGVAPRGRRRACPPSADGRGDPARRHAACRRSAHRRADRGVRASAHRRRRPSFPFTRGGAAIRRSSAAPLFTQVARLEGRCRRARPSSRAAGSALVEVAADAAARFDVDTPKALCCAKARGALHALLTLSRAQ